MAGNEGGRVCDVASLVFGKRKKSRHDGRKPQRHPGQIRKARFIFVDVLQHGRRDQAGCGVRCRVTMQGCMSGRGNWEERRTPGGPRL
jgi:hypothetical protein